MDIGADVLGGGREKLERESNCVPSGSIIGSVSIRLISNETFAG